MVDLLSYDFMQKAIIAALLVGLLCSTLSFFVVLKKLAFLGAGVSHTALGGIAIGLVLGYSPVMTGSIFAVVTAMSTGYLSRLGRVSEDTVIGIFYSSGMALGIALISSLKGYYPELFSLLFGNILSVTTSDLYLITSVFIIVLAFLSLFFKELLAICFDEEMAVAAGLPVPYIYTGLLAAIGITIMASIQLVGVVLVSALIVIPGATAYKLCSNYRGMMAVSVLFGLGSCLGGLLISYYFPVPPGAAIVLIMASAYAVLTGGQYLVNRLER